MIWQFFINNVEVSEPEGWDGFVYSLERSKIYAGLENVFSETSLTFDYAGSAILKNLYKDSGFDATATLTIKGTCDGEVIEEIDGVLNFMFYKEVNNFVTLKFEESGVHRKFKNRLETVVSLSASKSIGGVEIGLPPVREVGLHSKEILESGIQTASGLPATDTDTPLLQSLSLAYDAVYANAYWIVPPFDTLAKDDTIDMRLSIAPYFSIANVYQDYQANPLFVSHETREYQVKINLEGYFDPVSTIVTQTTTIPNIYIQYGLIIYDSFDPVVHAIVYDTRKRIGPTDLTFDINIDKPVTIPAGSSIWMFFQFNINAETIINIHYKKCSFTIGASTIKPPTTCKGYLIYDALNHIAKSITDQTIGIRSEFFGTPANGYEDYGCGALFLLTNGYGLRNFVQKDGTAYPVAMSFKQLFDDLDAIFNLGMRVEKVGYYYQIRIENKAYFYNQDIALSLDNVADIETQPAVEKLYNKFKIGYEKYNLNTGERNAIDEFNTQHNYTVDTINVKQGLSCISKLIASGFVLEKTRRQQYADNPTTDYETDADNFIIALNQSLVTSALYTKDKSSATYEIGTVSERNENFTTVENYLSPDTVYNLRISPKRNAYRWFPVWGAVVAFSEKPIKFQSGFVNILEKDTQAFGCREVDTVIQNSNILDSDLAFGKTLYIPNIYIFPYPISLKDFVNLKYKSNQLIEFSCSTSNTIKGYIESVRFEPNNEGGIAQFKVIEAGNTSGAFDSGFSTGFDIGE